MIRLRWAALIFAAGVVVLVGGCGGDSLPYNDTPVITALFPSSATAGGPAFTLVISGTGFISTSVAYWNNSKRTTTFNVTSTQLSVSITAQDIVNAGVAQITVFTPAPGGGISTAANFAINPANNPAPTIASISPSSTPIGVLPANGLLTVNGTNFIANSGVAFNGSPRSTNYVNATQLTAQVLASDVAGNATINVTVSNPPPGGGVSSAGTFQVGTGSAVRAKTTSALSSAVSLTLISASALGGPANGQSTAPEIDGNGRYVAFYSAATNLVPLGASGNVFVRDTCNGVTNCTPETSAIDLASDGSAPNGTADIPTALSTDGRFVSFASTATNLVSGAPAAASSVLNVYVRDLCTGPGAPSNCTPHTNLVSIGAQGGLGNQESHLPSISGDGRYISFVSAATNLTGKATGAQPEIYIRDTCAGPTAPPDCVPTTVIASLGDEDVRGAVQATISLDGRYIAFVTSFTPPSAGASGTESQIWIRDTCFGADAPAGCTPSTERISLAADGSVLEGRNQSPSLSADGRFVTFESLPSTSGATPTSQVYLRDTCLGLTAPSGCSPSTSAISPGSFPLATPSGRYVSFVGATGELADGGTASASGSFYVYDTCLGSTTLCTPQASLVAITARVDASTSPVTNSGRFAVFSTHDNIPSLALSGQGDVLLFASPF